jgi:hypothetical protein
MSYYQYRENQRVFILDMEAPGTVLYVANRWGAVTVRVDEAYRDDEEDDGVVEVDAEDLRPELLN